MKALKQGFLYKKCIDFLYPTIKCLKNKYILHAIISLTRTERTGMILLAARMNGSIGRRVETPKQLIYTYQE